MWLFSLGSMLLRYIFMIISAFCYNFILPTCISSKIDYVLCSFSTGSLNFCKFLRSTFFKSLWIIWKLILFLFLSFLSVFFLPSGLLRTQMAIDIPIFSLFCHLLRYFLLSTSQLAAQEHTLACCSYFSDETERPWKRELLLIPLLLGAHLRVVSQLQNYRVPWACSMSLNLCTRSWD